MEFNEYQSLAFRSAKKATAMSHIEHAIMGLTTEIGELASPVKRTIFYGESLDTTNMIEELGDILWYVALCASALGVSLEGIATSNVHKLQKRYAKNFTKTEAVQRKDKI